MKSGGSADDDHDDDLSRNLALLPRNDIGNAQRLIARYGADLIHVKDKGWYAWTGTHWDRKNAKRQARLMAHGTVAAIQDEARALAKWGPSVASDFDTLELRAGGENWDKLVKGRYAWSVRSGNSTRISAMLWEAAPHLSKRLDDLDSDPFMLNLINGTLALRRVDPSESASDLGLLPHQREHLITKVCPASYDPDAEAPAFRSFLDQVLPDKEIQAFLQRYIGYCLTGHTSEQCLVLLHGAGANGKSTLVDTVKWILGDYGMTLPFASLLQDDRRRGAEATPDLARLPGARLVSAAEPEIGQRFSESLIKTLTGGEAITARHLGAEFFEFKPSFKLLLSLNTKPSVRGQDEGIWRRLLMVPFDVTVPKAQRDRDLPAKLRGEASGILNWMIDGLRLWFESGLMIPDSVRAATEAYRRESDPLGQFLELATRRKPGARVQAKRFYAAYACWCRGNAIKPWSMTAIGRKLGDRGIEKERAGVFFYKDLELLERFEPPPHQLDEAS